MDHKKRSHFIWFLFHHCPADPTHRQFQLYLSTLTLLFVYSDDDHALVAAYADELVDGADTSTRQLAQEDHALDVVVLQKADVGAHLSDGPHVHHHDILHLWEPVLVKSTAEPRHCCEVRNS